MAAEKRKAETEQASSIKKAKVPYKADYKDKKYANREAEANGTSHVKTEPEKFKLETSSAEAHAKQRAQAKERKASKPNAEPIARSKKIWEQLRRKSHVSLEERKKLVAELFDIVTGRVRDFVFKHDSVRVIQCALKYANLEQRRLITRELQGDIRTLAESKYGKFLVAKMIMSGDDQIRDSVIPEFYGHVKRLINHPEASWIMDDIYRQVATSEQKAIMLREWYGAEFSLFKSQTTANAQKADLGSILEQSPEKRKPILDYLHDIIHGLLQKKMTGFTMLHDAMLQYFLVLAPGSEEQRTFLEEMLDDVDAEAEGGGGDLYKNLAFTKDGSRLACLALAYGTPKDRKIILRVFKDTMEAMAFDKYAKLVLTVGLEVPDDTQMTTKSIHRELLGEKIESKGERQEKMLALTADTNARLPVLFPLVGPSKWLIAENEKKILDEISTIRQTTSKKDPEIRRKELLSSLANPLLELVINKSETLAKQPDGWHVITAALFDLQDPLRDDAKQAVAELLRGDPADEQHLAQDPSTGRALKTLISGGNYNPATKEVALVEPRLSFATTLWPVIKDHVVAWACGPSSFAIVAMLETQDIGKSIANEVRTKLKMNLSKIKAAAEVDKSAKKSESTDSKTKFKAGNPGSKILVKKLE